VSMICGSDGILAKPTIDNGKIANGSLRARMDSPPHRAQQAAHDA
jgi:hypothetical protein